MELDPRFADDRLKFYYVTEDVDEALDPEERVRSSHNNVHIDTLPAGRLGLPVNIVSTFKAGEAAIDVLHPTIMILTKFKRWSVSYTSTRPKTIKKTASDRGDILFIIEWLAERKEQIRFHEYEGKTKPELLSMIRKYHDKYVDDVAHMETLQSIMPDDWEDMLALPKPEAENTVPPEAQNTRLPEVDNAFPLDVENTIPPLVVNNNVPGVEDPLPT
ncbi:uncharacterized protein TRAVEDRAFT_59322 [Trametes versicolor FP-101664 SS1]|uniref:uncharacterized protein n=1 Tax=Trametes versicolor (strain FP-101664) TaxID=717944 RepID=UPI0004622C47|nr:uncharacterized protein TRAVEDRAFT_59322 [Trametes versicolor FP-101664 SS1]EIW57753.1 hypothetical protein TRAVEDRAFT_59322 [Trametes versicolor FP-101664 SS1]